MNLSGGWILKVRDNVYQTLERLPKNDKVKLTRTIEELPADPYRGDIEKMEGELRTWRRRVGAYRIFYELLVEQRTIHVFRVERRTSKTY